MLPVLFILMLPSLIFGGLTSSGSSGQPILNDNAAIVQNTNDIAFAVNQILGEGITDAEMALPVLMAPWIVWAVLAAWDRLLFSSLFRFEHLHLVYQSCFCYNIAGDENDLCL